MCCYIFAEVIRLTLCDVLFETDSASPSIVEKLMLADAQLWKSKNNIFNVK